MRAGWGLDVDLAVMEVFHRDFNDPKYRPAALLKEMVAAGHLGEVANAPLAGAVQGVSMVQLVSAFPNREREAVDTVVLDLRRRYGHACIVAVLLPGILPQSDPLRPA